MIYEYTLTDFPGSYFYWQTIESPSDALSSLKRLYGKRLENFSVRNKK